MIQKIPRYLLTFHSTSGAIAVERFCKKHKIPGRLIPVPREISASCGLSWAVEAEVEIEDPEEYIKKKFQGKEVSYDKTVLNDGTIIFDIVTSQIKQRCSFTEI